MKDRMVKPSKYEEAENTNNRQNRYMDDSTIKASYP
jgi:hypothetical protein